MKTLTTINMRAIRESLNNGDDVDFSTIDGNEVTLRNEGDKYHPEYHLTLIDKQVDIDYKNDLDRCLGWLIDKEYFIIIEEC